MCSLFLPFWVIFLFFDLTLLRPFRDYKLEGKSKLWSRSCLGTRLFLYDFVSMLFGVCCFSVLPLVMLPSSSVPFFVCIDLWVPFSLWLLWGEWLWCPGFFPGSLQESRDF